MVTFKVQIIAMTRLVKHEEEINSDWNLKQPDT